MILLGKCFVVEEDKLRTKGVPDSDWNLLSCLWLRSWSLDFMGLSASIEASMEMVSAVGW